MVYTMKEKDCLKIIRREIRNAKKNGNELKYITIQDKTGDYDIFMFTEGGLSIKVSTSINKI